MIRDIIVLGTLCLALYLPGLSSIPPVDRDEARFAQSTRQMIESGDFIQPRFRDEDRFRKPVGIYWLQALSVSTLGGGDLSRIVFYRLPSLFGALVAVLLTYRFGRLWYPRRVAFTGAALLAGSLLLIVEAHLATTDAVLLALIVAAQGCLGAVYMAVQRGRPASWRYAAAFWAAQGAALLVKGPVAPLISGLTIAVLELWRAVLPHCQALRSSALHRLPLTPTKASVVLNKKRRGPRLRGDDGWGLLAGLHWRWGVPLMLVIALPWLLAITHESGGAFLHGWWHGDVLPKLVGGHESHGAPPGTHLALLPITFFPGSLALIPAFAFVRKRRRAVEQFCLAWLLPAWIVFEIIPTKLPHYILPLLPPLALLCARAAQPTRWGRTLAVGLGVNVALSITLLGLILPRVDAFWLSRRAADAIATYGGAGPIAAASYHEPSLVFLSRGDIALLDPEHLAVFLHDHPQGLGLIGADEHARFTTAADAIDLDTAVLWSGDGINYSKGRHTRLLLLANRSRKRFDVDAENSDHQAFVAR